MNWFIIVLSFRIVRWSPEKSRRRWCVCLGCRSVTPLARCFSCLHGVCKLRGVQSCAWRDSCSGQPSGRAASSHQELSLPPCNLEQAGTCRHTGQRKIIRWHTCVWARFPLLREYSASWWALAPPYERFQAILYSSTQSRGESIIPCLG